jgi:hypothetical protein
MDVGREAALLQSGERIQKGGGPLGSNDSHGEVLVRSKEGQIV